MSKHYLPGLPTLHNSTYRPEVVNALAWCSSPAIRVANTLTWYSCLHLQLELRMPSPSIRAFTCNSSYECPHLKFEL